MWLDLPTAFETSRTLELPHAGRDTVARSQTFDEVRDVDLAVYALRWP